jgi:YHS domain-containing protein
MVLTRLTIVVSMILLLSFSVNASDDNKEINKGLKNQTHCPVMGGAIDSTVFTDIQGHRVYHCCPMCTKKLKADPDKYFEEASKAGIIFENIQTFCPVSGKEIKEKEVFTYYNGRRVYFCCEGCIPKFEKEPQKYLEILDKGIEDKKPTPEHKNHNH